MYPRRLKNEVNPGEHICLFYENEQEQRRFLTHFLREGLLRNEKTLYIIDGGVPERVLDALNAGAPDVRRSVEKGQLRILTTGETYMQRGSFNPDAMVELLRSQSARALAEGRSALRVSGEMSWIGPSTPPDGALEYEARLNSVAPDLNFTVLCQYDVRRFSYDFLIEILAHHPLVASRQQLYVNLYYGLPQQFKPDQKSLGFWRCLSTLRKISEGYYSPRSAAGVERPL